MWVVRLLALSVAVQQTLADCSLYGQQMCTSDGYTELKIFTDNTCMTEASGGTRNLFQRVLSIQNASLGSPTFESGDGGMLDICYPVPPSGDVRVQYKCNSSTNDLQLEVFSAAAETTPCTSAPAAVDYDVARSCACADAYLARHPVVQDCTVFARQTCGVGSSADSVTMSFFKDAYCTESLGTSLDLGSAAFPPLDAGMSFSSRPFPIPSTCMDFSDEDPTAEFPSIRLTCEASGVEVVPTITWYNDTSCTGALSYSSTVQQQHCLCADGVLAQRNGPTSETVYNGGTVHVYNDSRCENEIQVVRLAANDTCAVPIPTVASNGTSAAQTVFAGATCSLYTAGACSSTNRSTCAAQLENPILPVEGGNCIPFGLPGQCVHDPTGDTYFRTTCTAPPAPAPAEEYQMPNASLGMVAYYFAGTTCNELVQIINTSESDMCITRVDALWSPTPSLIGGLCMAGPTDGSRDVVACHTQDDESTCRKLVVNTTVGIVTNETVRQCVRVPEGHCFPDPSNNRSWLFTCDSMHTIGSGCNTYGRQQCRSDGVDGDGGVTMSFFEDAQCTMPSPFHPARNLRNTYVESTDSAQPFFAADRSSTVPQDCVAIAADGMMLGTRSTCAVQAGASVPVRYVYSNSTSPDPGNCLGAPTVEISTQTECLCADEYLIAAPPPPSCSVYARQTCDGASHTELWLYDDAFCAGTPTSTRNTFGLALNVNDGFELTNSSSGSPVGYCALLPMSVQTSLASIGARATQVECDISGGGLPGMPLTGGLVQHIFNTSTCAGTPLFTSREMSADNCVCADAWLAANPPPPPCTTFGRQSCDGSGFTQLQLYTDATCTTPSFPTSRDTFQASLEVEAGSFMSGPGGLTGSCGAVPGFPGFASEYPTYDEVAYECVPDDDTGTSFSPALVYYEEDVNASRMGPTCSGRRSVPILRNTCACADAWLAAHPTPPACSVYARQTCAGPGVEDVTVHMFGDSQCSLPVNDPISIGYSLLYSNETYPGIWAGQAMLTSTCALSNSTPGDPVSSYELQCAAFVNRSGATEFVPTYLGYRGHNCTAPAHGSVTWQGTSCLCADDWLRTRDSSFGAEVTYNGANVSWYSDSNCTVPVGSQVITANGTCSDAVDFGFLPGMNGSTLTGFGGGTCSVAGAGGCIDSALPVMPGGADPGAQQQCRDTLAFSLDAVDRDGVAVPGNLQCTPFGLPGQCVFDARTARYYKTTCLTPASEPAAAPSYGGTVEFFAGGDCETLVQTIVIPEADTCITPMTAEWYPPGPLYLGVSCAADRTATGCGYPDSRLQCRQTLANGTDSCVSQQSGMCVQNPGNSSQSFRITCSRIPPSPAPPTAGPTPSPPPPTVLVCPNNCGQERFGGGTCESVGGVVQCTSCNDNKVLFHGRCVQYVMCQSRRIISGPLTNMTCPRCDDVDCNFCQIFPSPTVQVCRKCRASKYLYNNQCIDTCAANMTSVGITAYGRVCEVPPLTCRSNRALNPSMSLPYKCACPTNSNGRGSNCHECTFLAGQFGQQCTKCRGNWKLYNETCYPSCATSGCPSDYITYGVGSYGNECRPPFTCTNRFDAAGAACRCPRTLSNCRSCDWGIAGTVCTQCQSSRFLWMGACRRRCPSGTTSVIPSVNPGIGRVCASP
eukprot:m.284199 g.284199  ORF g.284199 m.284199 type:complete len:1636 (+) comp19900_c0_seq2:154-5061(+)